MPSQAKVRSTLVYLFIANLDPANLNSVKLVQVIKLLKYFCEVDHAFRREAAGLRGLGA